jgi:hypothetical protein
VLKMMSPLLLPLLPLLTRPQLPPPLLWRLLLLRRLGLLLVLLLLVLHQLRVVVLVSVMCRGGLGFPPVAAARVAAAAEAVQAQVRQSCPRNRLRPPPPHWAIC